MMENPDGTSAPQRRRLPSIEIPIAEILENPRTSSRVRITGMVVSVEESRREFTVNDGTGTIRVFSNETPSPKTLVRVIGRVSPLSEGGAELDAEIVHPLEGLDPKLLKEVRDLRHNLQKQYDHDHSLNDSV
jgi:hypothetical protein